ncbi:MAG: CoB--CoM heterodisulfide reductase iron-sulfur subunit B family protein [Actinomycetota bacterium]
MSYAYYPGCSLKSSGKPYEASLFKVFEAVGLSLDEIADWNCCGATSYTSVDDMKAYALAARNLAIAERDGDGGVDLVAPCAACYLVLSKAQHYMKDNAAIGEGIAKGLGSVGLRYEGRVRVRHPLDVLINDVGVEKIAQAVKKPLGGLKVACYYGCQIVRPYSTFDDQHQPTSMERLLGAAGAEIVDWPLKTRCCGGSLIGTIQEAGLRLGYILLKEAKKRGADVLVTACPLCQFNLECFQDRMSKEFDDRVDINVAFFTQVLASALGASDKEVGFDRLLKWDPPKPVGAEGGSHARA